MDYTSPGPDRDGERQRDLEAADHRNRLRSAIALTAMDAAAEQEDAGPPGESVPYYKAKRSRVVDVDPEERPVPVLRQRAEVRATREQSYEGQWCDVQTIAEITGFDADIVTAFIEKNRGKLGNAFQASRMQKRPGSGHRMVEHFSPHFVAWTAKSLLASWLKYRERTVTE